MLLADGIARDQKDIVISDEDPSTPQGIVTKRKEPLSPSLIQESESKRVRTDEYEYTIRYQNGIPIIEIID